MPAIRDEEYAAVVDRERPLIEATAYLLTGDPVHAERIVQLVFAQLYARWPRMPHPRLVALRAVVHTARTSVHLPWESRERMELIDVTPPVLAAVEPIVADLRMLTYDQRVAVVLDRYAGLTTAQIAQVLGRPAGDVLGIAGRARNMLAAGHAERTSDEAFLQELKDAIPYHMRDSHGSADDLAHGRRLARRRWIQRGSVVLVAVVLLIVATTLLLPTRKPVPQAGPSVPPIASPSSSQSCDRASATCNGQILLKWRSEMVEVTASHLDPSGKYFSGFGYFYDSRYDMPSFWSGRGGALAFQMFRLKGGATEVYLQIATSQRFAVRCGVTTDQECLPFRSMDGNNYLMTDSTLDDEGIEVQYWPRGDEVITVIARNTQRGQILDITSGDLIKLVQDDRLHLPKH
jgi:DNA-directed RNA polymerase specialized sigma24 family protein